MLALRYDSDSHSKGRWYFFSLLHFLQLGARFPFVLFPPLTIGTR